MADPATELVSGARRIGGAALDERVRRAAAGLAALGVARGDCVAILMRNDIAFIETAYAAQALGAYAVPVNWHFKAEEIVYILGDCGARVLVGHADLIAAVAAALPTGRRRASPSPRRPRSHPPTASRPCRRAPSAGAPGLRGLARRARAPSRRDALARRSPCSTPRARPAIPRACAAPRRRRQQMAALERLRRDVFGITPGIRCAVPGPLYHSAPNAFAMRAGRVAEHSWC